VEWTTESKSDIELFKVVWRKQGEDKWDFHEVQMNPENSNETTNTSTEFIDDGDDHYHGELVLTGLDPATTYEVTIASKNKFGLGAPGDLFIFQTKEEDPVTSTTIETLTNDADLIENKNKTASVDENEKGKVVTGSAELVKKECLLLTFIVSLLVTIKM